MNKLEKYKTTKNAGAKNLCYQITQNTFNFIYNMIKYSRKKEV